MNNNYGKITNRMNKHYGRTPNPLPLLNGKGFFKNDYNIEEKWWKYEKNRTREVWSYKRR